MYIERKRERDLFKGLAHGIVETGKLKICRAERQGWPDVASQVQMQSGRRIPSSSVRSIFYSVFQLLEKRITYITEGNLHYSVYWFKCCGCACMLSLSVVLDSGTPWTVALQASLSMGFPMQEYFSKLTIPSWGDLSSPGTEPTTPAWQVDSLPLSDLGSSDLNVNLI